jgi:hypothetical protein
MLPSSVPPSIPQFARSLSPNNPTPTAAAARRRTQREAELSRLVEGLQLQLASSLRERHVLRDDAASLAQQLGVLSDAFMRRLLSFERASMILEDRDSQKVELQYITERMSRWGGGSTSAGGANATRSTIGVGLSHLTAETNRTGTSFRTGTAGSGSGSEDLSLPAEDGPVVVPRGCVRGCVAGMEGCVCCRVRCWDAGHGSMCFVGVGGE